MIQQWNVLVDTTRRMTFEREDLAIGAAFDTASPAVPSVVTYPDGEEYVVLKRHPNWTITVSKVV